MTREKAIELVSCSSSMVLRVDENLLGIGILAYSYYHKEAVRYYFSKMVDHITLQVLSPVRVITPSKMRIVENHLEYDC